MALHNVLLILALLERCTSWINMHVSGTLEIAKVSTFDACAVRFISITFSHFKTTYTQIVLLDTGEYFFLTPRYGGGSDYFVYEIKQAGFSQFTRSSKVISISTW